MNEPQQLGQIAGNLKTSEWLLIAGAAWIFIVDYAIGNRISEDYFYSGLIVVAALSAALLLAVGAKHGGKESAWNALYPGTINAAGIVIVAFAVLDLLNSIVNEFSSSGEFYEITFYLAAAAIFAGIVLPEESGSA